MCRRYSLHHYTMGPFAMRMPDQPIFAMAGLPENEREDVQMYVTGLIPER